MCVEPSETLRPAAKPFPCRCYGLTPGVYPPKLKRFGELVLRHPRYRVSKEASGRTSGPAVGPISCSIEAVTLRSGMGHNPK